jgi:hypothetical protein
MYAFRVGLRIAPLLLIGAGAACAFALAACQPAAPPPVKKARRSFEESSAWKPSRSTAPAGGAASSGSNVDAQARQVQQTWEQAKQANNDADRQRLANEALKQTQSMAEQPSGQ